MDLKNFSPKNRCGKYQTPYPHTMRIDKLLERDLYRYQDGWVDNSSPVINVPTRNTASRVASSNVIGYHLQMWAEAKGVVMPRRWCSSFATTDTNASLYFDFSPFSTLNFVN